MSGKGSSPRPYSVDKKTFDKNWDIIFKTPVERDAIANEAFKKIEEKQKDNTPR